MGSSAIERVHFVKVDPAYRHHQKMVTSREILNLQGTRLKWYELAKADTPVPETIHSTATAFLLNEATQSHWELDAELGFVLLHLCGSEFYFLMVCTWRGSNELWQTVFYKENDGTPGFLIFPRDKTHKPTYCVWEMGVVWHEIQAWSRFLSSPRDQQAQADYLNARFTGLIS
jgi:hypothetical protein